MTKGSTLQKWSFFGEWVDRGKHLVEIGLLRELMSLGVERWEGQEMGATTVTVTCRICDEGEYGQNRESHAFDCRLVALARELNWVS
jgi:hypothetical protein